MSQYSAEARVAAAPSGSDTKDRTPDNDPLEISGIQDSIPMSLPIPPNSISALEAIPEESSMVRTSNLKVVGERFFLAFV